LFFHIEIILEKGRTKWPKGKEKNIRDQDFNSFDVFWTETLEENLSSKKKSK